LLEQEVLVIFVEIDIRAYLLQDVELCIGRNSTPALVKFAGNEACRRCDLMHDFDRGLVWNDNASILHGTQGFLEAVYSGNQGFHVA